MNTQQTKLAPSEYKDLMSARLKEFDANIQKLEAKSEAAKAETGIQMKKTASEFRAKLSSMQDKVEDLSQSGAKAWDDVQGGMEKAWHDMSGAWKDAQAKFN